MTNKPTPQPLRDDPAESQRFIDMAREVGADEGEKAMDKAFKRVISGSLEDHKEKQNQT